MTRKLLCLAILLGSMSLMTVPAAGQTTQPATPVEVGAPAQPAATQPTTAGAEGEGAATQDQPNKNKDIWLYVVMIGGFIVLWVWMGRNRRKQEQKRKEMLSSLKKGDKVTSIGGIMGTVIEVREDEVTVKVDETNNVRMKFARWAIRDVGEKGKDESAAS